MIRRIALIILLLFVGQSGIASFAFANTQEIELTSEAECDEEAEILVPASRNQKSKTISKQPVFRLFYFANQKFPTYRISPTIGTKASRHIIFRSLLI